MRGWVFALLLIGCTKPGTVARDLRPTPEHAPAAEPRCSGGEKAFEPLVVEWPSSHRAKLEALSHSGLVAVRAKGCDIEVLARCRVPGKYAWTPITRKEDRVSMRDSDELYANVPLGAASLEGKLARAGELQVKMTIVGRWAADRDVIRSDELEGDECANATHVVTGMVGGAFEFWAGSEAQVAAAANVMGSGAGAKSSSRAELLDRDGDGSACTQSSSADPKPPEGCGALLRIELARLGEAKQTPTCAGNTSWDGKQCASMVVRTSSECPAGTDFEGDLCGKPKAPVAAEIKPCVYGDAIGCTNACDAKSEASSCNDLALMLSRGDGLQVNDKRATDYYVRACELGNAIGCNNAGMRFEYGRGASKDETRASTLYQKACDASWAPACNNLGRLVAGGFGVAKDETRAVDLFGRGCSLGDPGSCANLGWFYVKGRGVAEDRTTGVGFLRKACTGGNGWSCDRLKALKEAF
jgi:hypothetical protein